MQTNKWIPYLTINKDGLIPCSGLGTYGLTEDVLLSLFEHYPYANMLIDTASKYNNEAAIATALKQCNINRTSVFLISKISYVQQNNGCVRDALQKSLSLLQTEYLDLYLIHSPKYGRYIETWEQLINLQAEGSVRYIGVSNFSERELEDLFETTYRWPDVNQIVLNPFSNICINNLIMFCQKNNILVQAAMPFGGAAEKEKWSLLSLNRQNYLLNLFRKGIVSLPGTSSYVHMCDNLKAIQDM